MAWINEWMSRIPDQRELRDVIMPGSHDAGVWPEVLEKKNLPKAQWAICQNGDFFAQATCGSRFFDCRVYLRKYKQGLSLEDRLRTAHFAGITETNFLSGNKGKVPLVDERGGVKWKKKGKTGGAGAYGGTLLQCMQDAIMFVTAWPREFLIIRFSHTGEPDCLVAAVRVWSEENGWTNKIYMGQGNIALKTMGDLRGKVVMIFEKESHRPEPSVGIHPYEKWVQGRNVEEGITCCGTWANKSDAPSVLNGALNDADAHADHPRDHLHFVYYQQTMLLGDIKAATEGASGVHQALGGFLGELTDRVKNDVGTRQGRDPSTVTVDLLTAFPNLRGRYRYPNVISHDFVCEDTCKRIVKMNPAVNWPP
jgi:hypothetical protein